METFSNSPPWFMTESGYVSGNYNASQDQLKRTSIGDFTAYLVKVTEHLEAAHGIKVDTIDPFNELNTSYWGTQLGADGRPTGGRQEAPTSDHSCSRTSCARSTSASRAQGPTRRSRR